MNKEKYKCHLRCGQLPRVKNRGKDIGSPIHLRTHRDTVADGADCRPTPTSKRGRSRRTMERHEWLRYEAEQWIASVVYCNTVT
jgi:hypothetical protein